MRQNLATGRVAGFEMILALSEAAIDEMSKLAMMTRNPCARLSIGFGRGAIVHGFENFGYIHDLPQAIG